LRHSPRSRNPSKQYGSREYKLTRNSNDDSDSDYEEGDDDEFEDDEDAENSEEVEDGEEEEHEAEQKEEKQAEQKEEKQEKRAEKPANGKDQREGAYVPGHEKKKRASKKPAPATAKSSTPATPKARTHFKLLCEKESQRGSDKVAWGEQFAIEDFGIL
jgi:hypothetical protein